MNKIKRILLVAAVAAVAFTSLAQDTPPPIEQPDIPNWMESPITQFLLNGTNWMVAPYAIVNTTTKEAGAGIGAGYKISEFLVPTMRLDYVGGKVWVPSGSIQLQLPLTFFGKVKVTPFTFTGIATSFNNDSESGGAIGIFGIGGSVSLKADTEWYVPKGIIGDYERWTGGGFNDNQIRIGFLFKF